MIAVVALVLYLLWMAAAFGLRTVLQIRRTGDSGLRGSGLATGSVQWWTKLLFLAAIATGLAGPVAALLGLDPLAVLDRPDVQLVGAALAIAGITATVLAQLSMGDSWRIGVDDAERTTLVTSGAFRRVRNPIFTAMIGAAIGFTLLVPNLIAVAGLVALVVAIHLQVRLVEEPYLRRMHGTDYRRYEARAGRFLPRLGGAESSRGAVN